MMFQQFKAKLVGAKKGHGLLKKKRDALKARFQAMLKEIVECKLLVGVGLKDAAFTFARAQWANGGDDIASTVLEKAKTASVTCGLKADNVAGVKLPVFKIEVKQGEESELFNTIGIADGGAVMTACRDSYRHAAIALIKLASLQTTFRTLDEEIKMTGRRVNALEYVIIPKIEEIMKYIEQEMDEQAREEFFRVKKVVEKKKLKLAKEAQLAALEAAGAHAADEDDIVY
jgi:V-type H+-transporting ATPase subunit D